MKGIFGCLGSLFLYLLYVGVAIAIGCGLAAWLCNINPEETYVWYSGIWQGLFCIPNWVRGFFFPDVLYKAVSYTGGYNFFWWLMLILTLLGIIGGGNKAK